MKKLGTLVLGLSLFSFGCAEQQGQKKDKAADKKKGDKKADAKKDDAKKDDKKADAKK